MKKQTSKLSIKNKIKKITCKKIITWVTLAMYLTQPVITAASVAADQAAAAQNRPTIDVAANGVPIVQIAVPSLGGVSHNKYQQFNVGPNGLILNNSPGIVNTKLAGYIMGNANVTGNGARIILNEVTGPGISSLRGYTEIAGQKADLIIANPNGIVGDGFGFINAGRTVLTTGTPIFGGSGSLEAFRVARGEIAIQGAGLNASDGDRVDLLSRAITVNSGIWAKEINAVTGANQIDYKTLAIEKLSPDTNSPQLALDVGALGGMYANKITLIGSEKGVGFNSKGTIAASADLILTSQGKITLTGKTIAQENMNINTTDDFHNTGTLYAQGNLAIQTQTTLHNTGLIAGGQNTTLTAQSLHSSGTIGAGIKDDGSFNETGNLSITTTDSAALNGQNLAAGNLSITTKTLDLTQATTYAGNNIELQATGDINNTGGSLKAVGNIRAIATGNIYNDKIIDQAGQIKAKMIQLSADNISNRGGKIVQYGTDNTTITATSQLDNTNGEITTNGNNIRIQGTTITNKDGRVAHAGQGTLYIKAKGQLINDNGKILTNDNLVIDAQSIDNRSGNLASKNQLQLDSKGDIQNSQGAITSADSLTITTQGTIINTNGNMEGAKKVQITADNLINAEQGHIVSVDNSGLTITTTNVLQNSGLIGSNGTLLLTGKEIQNHNGKISAQQDITITAEHLSNDGGTVVASNNLDLTAQGQITSSGTIAAGNGVQIQADSLTSTGTMGAGIKNDGSLATVGELTIKTTSRAALQGKNLAAGNINIKAGRVSMAGSTTYAGNNLTIQAVGDIDNSGSKLTANEKVDLTAAGKIYNDKTADREGEIKGESIYLSATDISNCGGKIVQYGTGNTIITATSQIDNTKGEITTNGNDLRIQGTTITNMDGKMTHAGQGILNIKARSQLNNDNGKILTNGNLAIDTQSIDNTKGNLASKNQLNLNVKSYIQNSQGDITSGDILTITTQGTITNTNGNMEGAKKLEITADILINAEQGHIVSVDNSGLTIATTNVLQNNGLIGSNGNLIISSNKIQNNNGKISAKKDMTITAEILSNDKGTVVASNNLNLTAQGQIISSGTIAAGNDIQIQADSLTSTGTMGAGIKDDGSLATVGDLTIKTTNRAALQGKNLAASNINVKAGQVSMVGSTTYAGNNLTIQAVGDIDNSSSKLTANANLDLTATGKIYNDKSIDRVGEIKGEVIHLSADNISNRGGKIVQYGTEDTAIIATSQIDNTNGEITTNGNDLKIHGTTITNTDGKIAHAGQGTLYIKGREQLKTDKGNIITNGNLAIDALSIDNTKGNLASKKQLKLNGKTDIQNNQGNITSSDNLTITTQGTITNTNGNVESAKNLSITGDSLLNAEQGRIVSLDDSGLTIITNNLLQNSGLIGSNGTLLLTGKEVQNQNGKISAQKDMNITVDTLSNTGGTVVASNNLNLTAQGQITSSGTIIAGKDTQIQAGDLTSTGTIGAGIKSDGSLNTSGDLTIKTIKHAGLQGKNLVAGNIDIKAGPVNMAGSTTYAGNNLTIRAVGDIDNSSSKLTADGKLELTATGKIYNDQTADRAGEIKGESIHLSAADISNRGGKIVQYGTEDTTITVTSQIDNTNGEITTNGNNLRIQGATITNTDGKIAHAGQGELNIQAKSQLKNHKGNIVTNGNLAIDAQSIDNMAGNLVSKKQLNLNVQNDIQNNQGNINSGDSLTITTQGVVTNTKGSVEGAKSLYITAGSLSNAEQGRIVNVDNSGLTIVTTNSIENEGLIGSNGAITLTGKDIQNHNGKISAQNDMIITAETLNNDGGTVVTSNNLNLTLQGQITNSGTIVGGNDVQIRADSLTSTGTIGSGIKTDGSLNTSGDLTIKTTKHAGLEGKNLAAGNINVNAGQVSMAGSTTYAGNNLAITTTGDLDNTNSKLTANKKLDILAKGTIKNQAGGQLHAEQINLAAENISNHDSKIVQYGTDNTIIIANNQIDNTNGEIATNGNNFTLQGTTIINNSGEITHAGPGVLSIKTIDQLTNGKGKILTNGNLAIHALAIDNIKGNLTSQKQVNLETQTAIENSQGNITSGDSLTITTQGTINNTNGSMEGAKEVTIRADQVINGEQGRIVNIDNSGININLTSLLQNGGLIGSNGTVILTSKELQNHNGKISAKKDMTITADTLSNVGGTVVSSNNLNLTIQGQITSSGTIAAGNDTQITADSLTSTGTIGAGIKSDGSLHNAGDLSITTINGVALQGNNLVAGNMNIKASQVSMAGSTTYAGNNLAINTAGDLDNTNSKLTANKKMDLIVKGTIKNQAGGQLQAEQINLSAASISNHDSKIVQYGTDNTTIAATSHIDNTNGEIATNGNNLTLQGTTITNTDGKITHAGSGVLSIKTSEQLKNNNGKILTNANLVIDTLSIDNRSGNLVSKNQLTLTTKTDIQNNQGNIISGDSLTINTQGLVTNTNGNIEGAKSVHIAADNLTNAEEGRIVSLDNSGLTITTTSSLENSGLIGSNGTLTLTGKEIQNSKGQISAKNDMNIIAENLSNSEGTLVSSNNLNLTVEGQITSSGTMVAGNDAHISGDHITSTGTIGAGVKNDGSLDTNGDLTIKTKKNAVLQGKNLAASNTNIEAAQVIMAGSTTYTGNNLAINTTGDIDNTNSKLTANKRMDLIAKGTIKNQAGGQLQAEQINLTADNISNHDSKIIQSGTDNTVVTATRQIDNTNGEIATNSNNLTLQGTTITNTNGKITHAGQGKLQLKATGELKNDNGKIVTNANLAIDAQFIDNAKGSLSSQQQLNLNTKTSMQNSQGNIMAGDSLTITSQGTVTNTKGNIEGAKNLNIVADSLTNGEQGRIISLDNSGLTIKTTNDLQNSGLIGGNGTLTLTGKEIQNHKGQISANDNLTILAQQGLDNATGTIYAGKDVTIDQPNIGLINNNGTITAQDNAIVKASQVQNNGGKIATNNNLTLQTTTIIGGGKIQTGNNLNLNLQGDYVQNQGSEFKANGNLNLTTTGNIINNGTISAVNNLGLTGMNITNTNNAVLTASNRVDLHTTGVVDNAGRIDSNIVGITANNISNTGSIIAGSLGIKTNTLNNTGDKAIVATTNGTTILAHDKVENKDGATIYSLGNVIIAGNDKLGKANSVLNQSATIEAGQDIGIFANDIINKKRVFATQEQVLLVTSHSQPIPYDGKSVQGPSLDNYEYHSNITGANREYKETVTQTKVTQDSISGKIVAGRNISLGAMGVTNEASNILAAGGLYVVAPTINNVAVGARRVTTQDGSDIYSIHEMKFRQAGGNGGGCGEVYHNDYTKTKPYYNQTIENLPGTASIMLGQQSVTINTVNLNNTTTHADNIAVGNASTFKPGTINSVNSTTKETSNVSIGGIATKITSNSDTANSVTSNTKETSTVCIGGIATNIASNSNTTNSVNSNTKAISTASIDGITTNIISSPGTTNTVSSNTKETTSASIGGIATNITSNHDTTTSVNPTIKPITTESTDGIGVHIAQTPGTTNTVSSNTKQTTTASTGSIATNIIAGPKVNIKEADTRVNQTFTLPGNGLYAIHKEPGKPYLVETDSRFTSYKNFLSSDYLLQKLSYDPAKVQKRLGDGFYEQKLVRDQITELTGRSTLHDDTNNEEQFKRLLENGAADAKNFNLQVGISLTPEQMAHLTSDIVWMVEKEVDGQKVLVPVVYLAKVGDGTLKRDGALITGGNVQITATGDITNTGSITATDKLIVHGNNILNRGGLISGSTQTELVAKQDIINQSGTISGGKVDLIAGRDIKNETLTAATHSTTLVSQQAKITATDNLTIKADRDINLAGTKVSGLDINLTAGHNLDIGSVTHIENQGLKNSTTQLISDITASGNLTLVAKNDLKLSGVTVDVGKDATLTAGHNLELTTLENNSVENGTRTLIGATDIRTSTTNIDTTIKGKGSIALVSGNDTLLKGININVEKDVTLTAGRNLDILSAVDKKDRHSEDNGSNHIGSITTNLTSDIKAGNNIVITGEKDVTFQGVQLNAGNDLTVKAGGNLIATAVKDEERYDNLIGNLGGSYTRKMTDDEIVIGTNINAKNKVSITATGEKDNKATGNIILEGSHVNSEKGEVVITAANDVTIKNSTEYHETLTESKKIDSGFFSTKVTENKEHSIFNQVSGSTIYGDKVTITAGNDLVVKGSNVVGTNDVSLTATGNVNITSAKETGKDENYHYEKTSGLFSGGGLGFTIGSKSEKTTTNLQTVGEVGSTIGSINGSVSITAGKDVNSAGTTFVTGKDLNITGKNVTIDNTINTYDSQTKYEFKQTGLSVSLGGGIVDTGMNAYNNIKRSGQVQDDRLKVLYDYKAVKDIQKLGDYKGNLGKDLGISGSIGSSQTTTEQTSHTETVNTSNINAGGNVKITATAGDVNLKGTNINATDITLDAQNNINIEGASNKQQTTSETSSSSWSIGASFDLTSKGVGYFGNISSGKGSENGISTTNTGSVIDATGTLTIKSGKDTTINGSQVKGENVVANIGGDLNIVSVQDTDNYKAKNQSSSFGFATERVDGKSLPPGTQGPINQVTSLGLTGSYNKGKTDSVYASVMDQAGIFAGKDGFDITVGKNTDLKGAVISSTATPDKNKLSTDTLTYSDIQNKADYNSGSTGVNLNTKSDAKLNERGLTPIADIPVSGDADSTTKAAVSPGTIEIRSNPKQDISGLSRNITDSLNRLDKIFDKQTVQERKELIGLFGQLAFEEVHKISKINGWDESSSQKIALHALIGGIMSDLAGSGFKSGAVGAGFNEALQKELSNITDPALRQWASYIIGSTVAGTVGGMTALYGTKYNSFMENGELRYNERYVRNSKGADVLLVQGSVGLGVIASAFNVSVPSVIQKYVSTGGAVVYDPVNKDFYPAVSGSSGYSFGLPVGGGVYGLDLLDLEITKQSGEKRKDLINKKIKGVGYQITLSAGLGVTLLLDEDRNPSAIGLGFGLEIGAGGGYTFENGKVTNSRWQGRNSDRLEKWERY